MLFDTHAHYDDAKFEEDRDRVLQNAFENEVSYILNACSSPESLDSGLNLAERYENIYAAVGIHPHDAAKMSEALFERIRGLLAHPKVVAVGEIGLDYHYDFSPRDVQQKWFIRQIELAKEVGKPIIIHNRESTEDMLRIVLDTGAKDVGGVFHCFSGSMETAKIALDNNFYLGFGGPVTFKNAKKTLEVLDYVPVDRILLETDCPYLAPEPFRGGRNDSSYLKFIAKKVAEAKKISYEELAKVTQENAFRLFKMEKKSV